MALPVSQLPILSTLPTILTVWPKLVTLRTVNATATAVAEQGVGVGLVTVRVGVENVLDVVEVGLAVWPAGKPMIETVE